MSEENNNEGQEQVEESELVLHRLSPVKGARRPRRRIGRGEASGHGKTCGRGNKGQTSRSGASIPAWFEGGQMPLYRRIGKIGFRSRKQYLGRNRYVTIPVSFLEQFDNGSVVNAELLESCGVKAGPKTRAGVKVLGDGELTKKLSVELNAVTASAKAKIEAAGGTVTVVSPRASKVETAKSGSEKA